MDAGGRATQDAVAEGFSQSSACKDFLQVESEPQNKYTANWRMIYGRK
jgi:hypothetical protein